jgi:hypothetical protein
MAKHFRIKRRPSKSGVRFQLLGPDPKTGEEISYGTFTSRKEAEAQKHSRQKNMYNLTEFGRMESRTVADLAAAFLANREQRKDWTLEHNAWHERGKSFSPETLRHYRDAITRHIVPKLGDIVLIALDFDDVQRMVKSFGARPPTHLLGGPERLRGLC